MQTCLAFGSGNLIPFSCGGALDAPSACSGVRRRRFTGTKKYCDLAAVDIQTFLENSQKYNVSSKLVDEKYYYETALENMAIGVETASRGYAIGDTPQGNSFLNTAAGYMNLATQELNNLTSVEPITQTTIYESPAGEHSCTIGTPGISEFLINWTDNKNYENLKKDTFDLNQPGDFESPKGIGCSLYAIENAKSDNYTLRCSINWYPEKIIRPDETVPDSKPEVGETRKDITIQGKKAILFKFKDKKLFEGQDVPPTINPAHFYVSFYPDDHTSVSIDAPASAWTDSEFNAAITSFKITPPAGYY